MTLTRAQPLEGRRARLILDRARNPETVSLHAARRFLEDAIALGEKTDGDDIYSATRCIRDLCLRAKRIYRSRDSYVLRSQSWWIFYRDSTVTTVLHEQSKRKF